MMKKIKEDRHGSDRAAARRGKMVDVVVVGAGISGLSAAFFLKEKGYRVMIVEKESRVGGNIRSERRQGFLIEYGPNSILETTPALGTLIDAAGLRERVIYAGETAKKRYILRDRRLQPLPTSLPAFIKTELFSGRAKRRLLREPFIKPYSGEDDESLAAFVVRRLGQEFLDYAINPFVAGVYAGAPERLSVRHGFPKLYQLEQKYGSLIRGTIGGMRERKRSGETAKDRARMLSFEEGLSQLTDTLGERLKESLQRQAELTHVDARRDGVWLKYKQKGREQAVYAGHLLFTVPAQAYNHLPLTLGSDFMQKLKEIYYPPVSMVFLGYDSIAPHVPRDGFGFLVPAREKRRILGTLWNSSIFRGRAPEKGMALTTFVGGSRQPEMAKQSSEELINLVKEELRDIMGLNSEPAYAFVKPWPRAIPQYVPGYGAVLEAMEAFEKKNPRLHLAGNFRNGISVADCIKQSWQLSENLHRVLSENSHGFN